VTPEAAQKKGPPFRVIMWGTNNWGAQRLQAAYGSLRAGHIYNETGGGLPPELFRGAGPLGYYNLA